MDNAMVLVIGVENSGDLYIETMSEFDDKSLIQIANMLFILTNGGLSDEIRKHIKKFGASKNKKDEADKLLSIWSKLERSYEDKPLVDSLQP